MSETLDALDLGVLVVTYRSGPCLPACLESLLGLTDTSRLLIVDAASPDDTLEIARRQWPGVRTVSMDRNAGFAAAVNVGLRELDERYILILNADTIVEPGGVRRAVGWMEQHPRFGMLGPALQSRDGSAQASRYREPSIRNMARMYLLRDQREPDPVREIEGVLEAEGIVGAAMLVRRSAVQEIGAMDEGFFLYCEEVDWCTRLRRAGYHVGTLASWGLVHLGGASTATLGVHTDVISHRSRYLYFLKHGGEGRAEMFRLLLLASLPWVAAVACLNGVIGRVRWSEAMSRVRSQAATVVHPLPRLPEC